MKATKLCHLKHAVTRELESVTRKARTTAPMPASSGLFCYLGAGIAIWSIVLLVHAESGTIISHDVSGNVTSIQTAPGAAPEIRAQTGNEAVNAGSYAYLSVGVAGSSGLSFQWFLNGTGITGATNDTLGVFGASSASGGYYSVRVANSYGAVTSAPALLIFSPATNDIIAAAGGPNGFVAQATNQNVLWSSNGIVWQQGTGMYRDLIWGAGLFGAVSSNGLTIYTSLDGNTWSNRHPNNLFPMYTIAYGNGLWFAAGQLGRYSYSSDLVSWVNTYYLNYTDFRFIEFVRDRFFLASMNKLYFITNGVTPYPVSGVASAHLINCVAYGNGRFVGVGDYGNVIVSTDGTNWTGTQVDTSPVGDADNTMRAFTTVVFVNGYFVAAGPPGRLFVSTDGLYWTGADSGVNAGLRRLVYNKGLLLGFGQGGVIAPLVIPPVVQIVQPTNYAPVVPNAPLALTATAGSALSSIQQVTFFVEGAAVGTVTNVPYSVTWTPPSNGLYHIYATALDADGNSSQSATIGLGDRTAPSILVQPAGQVVVAGFETVLSVVASGTEPLQYQWYENGLPLDGENEAVLDITGGSAGSAADFYVQVSNLFGQTNSQTAHLTVTSKPVIVQQPLGSTNLVGDSVTLFADVVGAEPMSYQWFKDYSALPNATNASLALENLQNSDSGHYSLHVMNAYTTSAVASSNALVRVGTFIFLEEALDGSGFTWAASGKALWLGQTNVTHDGKSALQSGRISNNQTSTVALMNPLIGPGTLSFWWKVSSETNGDYVAFSAGLTSWTEYLRLSGEQDWVQVVEKVSSGSYYLKWDYIKNGSLGSGGDAAWLDEVYFVGQTDPALILAQPKSQGVVAGGRATFTGVVMGTGPFVYQWQLNGTNLPGASAYTVLATNSLTLTNVQSAQAGPYQLLVSNPYGNTVSATALLSVLPPTPVAYDFAEGNAAVWGSFAIDTLPTSLANDNVHTRVGSQAIKFTTQSGTDTGVTYPAAGNAHWFLLPSDSLAFWTYAINTNAGGFQGNQPTVVLHTPPGDFIYKPQGLYTTNNAWSYCLIPLAGNGQWLRSSNGTPNLGDVNQIQIHQDTSGYGFTAYYDGVRFITQTPIFTGVLAQPNGWIQLSLYSPSNRLVNVQASTNLVNWMTIVRNVTGGDPLVLIDTNAFRFKQRFYRAVIQTAPELGVPVRGISGSMQFTIYGNPTEVYAVQSSTNLVTWLVLGTVTNSGGTAQFTDGAAASFARRFYRAVRQ